MSPTSGSPAPHKHHGRHVGAVSSYPKCHAVWVAGGQLPASYTGCADHGQVVASRPMNCESGQTVYTYSGRYYAAAGNKINGPTDLRTDPTFQEAKRACSA